MDRRALLIILLGVMVGTLVPTSASGADSIESDRGTPEPCYVVIAVDVSGSMERTDTATTDARGRRWTLRDEGQLVLLQLLPFVYSDLHVGVCHFSDRVRYALPSEETGPLLPWGDSYLSEAACRNLVRPAEFMSSFRTDIPASLSWAAARIQAARQKHGAGSGKVLLLSHGSPRDSSKELDGGGPMLRTGARLAEQNIQVYPIIINKASYRPGKGSSRLSSSERAAERVMTSLAQVTGGQVYRISRQRGFPDALMDVFGLGTPMAGETHISPYDWAVMMVGPAPNSVAVTASGPAPDTEAVTWGIDDGLDAASGIRARAVSSVQWPVTILRRPDGTDSVDRFWKGRWELRSQDGPRGSALRLYRIPDFLLQLEVAPESPWWAHEQGQLRARLLDRHAGGREAPYADPAVKGAGLAVRLTAQTKDQAQSFRVDGGQWAIPARLYATEPFTVEAPGQYDLTGALLYAPGDVNVPLISVTRGFQVLSAGVGIDIRNAVDDRLGQLPQTADVVSLDTEGGREVSFRVVPRGSFGAETVSGSLHLAPLAQSEWTLGKDASGNLTTGLIRLPEGEDRLTGWVRVEVQVDDTIRQFRLPDFELTYRPAPTGMRCAFGDSRAALWVGEFHRQLLTLAAFPVFEDSRERALSLFPETLSGARMRTVALQSGTAQVTQPRSRLVAMPKPTGEKGRTLVATYALEATAPIPPADQCEIGLDGTIRDLQGATKTYAVVDPVADGLFKWTLHQGSLSERSEGVSDVVYCGEPVTFSAQWRADQNISAVRVEIPRPEPNAPFLMDLPVVSGTHHASVEQVMPQLEPGRTYPVYVYVTRGAAGDAPALQIKLHGGQFRAEDRRLILEEMVVGTETAKDVSCHAWEPTRIPLRMVFSGYLAGNRQHSALIEQLKGACTLVVTSSQGDTRDVTDSIEWTSLVPAEIGQRRATRCELQGHAAYMPQNTGRAAVELKAEFSQGPAAQADTVQRALGHLSVREPRLVVTVQKLMPSGVEAVFDSPTWVRGVGGLFPVTARFSTRLQVTMQRGERADDTPSGLWDITLQVLRRATPEGHWVTDLSEVHELSGRAALNREVQITKDGQYALEIVGRAAATGQVLTRFQTPVLITIRQHKVEPALAPPAWITPHVRRWPFEYQVTLHQESGDLSQAELTFQFQLPGEDPAWLDGSIQAIESASPDERQLLAKGPDLMPVLSGLVDGAVKFRLSGQGLELLNWEYPNVRVLAPMLEKLVLSRADNDQEIPMTGGAVSFVGATGLSARPVFRPAPGLTGQWVREKTLLYLWPNRGDASPGSQGPLSVLQRLAAQGRVDAESSDGAVFVIAEDAPDQVVQILSRHVRYPFWGWPTSATTLRYNLAASAVYRPLEASNAPASASTDRNQTILEWTPVYSLQLVLPRVVPWCWWFLAGVLVFLSLVVVLRLLARRPDRLGLDLRLEENVAAIDPAGAESPIRIELRQTPLGKDMELHRRYLASRWEGAGTAVPLIGPALGRFLGWLAIGVAGATVLIRRCLYPRRWAWALITPKLGGSSRYVRKGLVCVWTSPLARKGRLWSSETGLLDLPAEGQAKSITLELAYRMGPSARTMRVGIRIRKMAPDGAKRTVDGSREADSELVE